MQGAKGSHVASLTESNQTKHSTKEEELNYLQACVKYHLKPKDWENDIHFQEYEDLGYLRTFVG